MALQDDIFDIRHALKGKPEAKAFERIEHRLNAVEQQYTHDHALLEGLRQGARAVQELLVGEA